MIYSHWSKAPWDAERWPNFSRAELACKRSSEYYHWPDFLNRLQAARTAAGKPFRINSAHRSFYHNWLVGGAPASEHLRLAIDIDLRGHDRHELKNILREVGFTGFGYYNSFIHIDLRDRPAFWFGKGAKSAWLD